MASLQIALILNLQCYLWQPVISIYFILLERVARLFKLKLQMLKINRQHGRSMVFSLTITDATNYKIENSRNDVEKQAYK